MMEVRIEGTARVNASVPALLSSASSFLPLPPSIMYCSRRQGRKAVGLSLSKVPSCGMEND